MDRPHDLARGQRHRSPVCFGEAPGSPKACDDAETADPGPLRRIFHATDDAFWKDVWYWQHADRRTASTAGRTRSARTSTTGSRPGPRSRAEPARPSLRTAGPGTAAVPRPSLPASRPPRRPAPTGRAPGEPIAPARRVADVAAPPSARRSSGLLLAAAPAAGSSIAYLGSLVVLFLNAFWSTRPVHRRSSSATFTLDNFVEILATTDVYRVVTLRTVGDGRRWSRRPTSSWHSPSPTTWPGSPRPATRGIRIVSILLPLWSGYLVKAYAWRTDPRRATASSTGSSSPSGSTGPGLRRRRGLARLQLPLAAVHDPADLRRPRADPVVAARGIGRPGRPRLA